MGPALRRKLGTNRCKDIQYSQDHQKRPNDHTQSQGKEIVKRHNGKLQFKQYRQQKLLLSTGTNDFLKKQGNSRHGNNVQKPQQVEQFCKPYFTFRTKSLDSEKCCTNF